MSLLFCEVRKITFLNMKLEDFFKGTLTKKNIRQRTYTKLLHVYISFRKKICGHKFDAYT